MLFSKVENCHNLAKICLVCDYRLHRGVCFASRRTASTVWKTTSSGTAPPASAESTAMMCMIGLIQITCWKAAPQKGWGESQMASSGSNWRLSGLLSWTRLGLAELPQAKHSPCCPSFASHVGWGGQSVVWGADAIVHLLCSVNTSWR